MECNVPSLPYKLKGDLGEGVDTDCSLTELNTHFHGQSNAELFCCATSCLDSAEGRRVIEKYEEILQLLDR